MSFFQKLKKGAGIEEEVEEIEQKVKQPSVKRKKVKKMITNQPPKLEPKNTRAKKESAVAEGELAVDVYQTENDLIIQAAIAGVQASVLDIAFEDDMLIISGERQKPESEQTTSYLYQECYWGPFSRKIILPEEIDVSKAEAAIKQGILTIKAPRIPKRKVKKIVVKEE